MSLVAFLAFNAALLTAAAWDLRFMRIPNAIPLMLSAGSLLLHPPTSVAGALGRLAVVAMVATVCLALYLRNALGGGDVKLLVACALWLPLSGAPTFATALGVAGALQGLGTLLLNRLSPAVQPRLARANYHQMPYGVSIAAAGLFWSMLATFGP